MQDDRQLIARVLARNAVAADLFVTRFSRFVWAILVRHLGVASEQAEDLYQEVFLRLCEDDYRRLRLWSGDGDFAAYLAPIVRNLALDRMRSHPGDREPNLREDDIAVDRDPRADEMTWIAQQREMLSTAVGNLTDRDRELYRQRFEQERSYREIAVAMGMTVNNVGVSISRLVERLRGAVRAEFVGEPVRTPPRGSSDG